MKLLIAALLFIAPAAQASIKEACIVLEEHAGGKDLTTQEIVLPKDSANGVPVALKLLANIKIELAGAPADMGSDSVKNYAVAVTVSNLDTGATFESYAIITNELGHDEVGHNIQSVKYDRPGGDHLEINCAAVER